ncbi:MAG: hypothetical protein RLZZ471_718 [Actinomycetota bacterium]
MNGISTQGMVFIHSAPRALLPHLEWTMGRILGGPVSPRWLPIGPAQFRTEFHWQGDDFAGTDLTSQLMGWKSIRFEVTTDNYRWSFTPKLGLFHSETDAAGNLLVNEFRLKEALQTAGSNAIELQRQMRMLMGQPWDDELEQFRMQGADAPIIWLKSASN